MCVCDQDGKQVGIAMTSVKATACHLAVTTTSVPSPFCLESLTPLRQLDWIPPTARSPARFSPPQGEPERYPLVPQQAQMSDEKMSTFASDIPSNSRAPPFRSTYRPADSFIPARLPPPSSSCPRSQSYRYVRPRGLRIWNLFKKWSPVLAYAATSLGFLLAIALWKTEVFDGE